MGCDQLGAILEAIYPARSKWHNIGVHLKVPPATLKSISHRYPGDRDCLCETMKIWLKMGYTPPSWGSLIDALCSVGMTSLGRELAQLYCPEFKTPEGIHTAKGEFFVNCELMLLQGQKSIHWKLII